jgi:2-methylcitrate dehydratase PrpD
MTNTADNVTDTLAAFVTDPGVTWPKKVTEAVKQTLLGYSAAAAHGCQDPVWQNIYRGVALRSHAGPHGCVGLRESLDIRDAVFLNAVAGNAQDFDDTHVPTIIHPCSVIVPVVMALAQERQSSASEIIKAILMGYEVMCRLGNAVHPEHYQKGHHITATCGVVGASVSAALLLKLSPSQTRDAMAIAAGQASGLIENLASQVKAFAVGAAARDGMLAAEFAQQGLTGPADPLGGTYGFLRVLCQKPQPTRLTEGLGTTWQILQVTYKPYPVGVVLNPVIDAALTLHREGNIPVEAIESIEVRGHALLLKRTDRPVPAHPIDARLSTQHTVAAALVQGLITGTSFERQTLQHPAVARLRDKIYLTQDDTLDVESATISVKLGNGKKYSNTTINGLGSVSQPMQTSDLANKLRLALSGADVEARVGALVEKSSALDTDPLAHEFAQTIVQTISYN